jgi:hypothetical protein
MKLNRHCAVVAALALTAAAADAQQRRVNDGTILRQLHDYAPARRAPRK